MLVLTRSPSQEIRIGHDIVVRVLDVKGDRVRIGIDAPSEVTVHREEIYLEIARTNQEAARSATPDLTEVIGLAGATGAAPDVKGAVVAPRRRPAAAEEDHGT